MAEDYRETSVERVNSIYEEIKDSLGVIYDGLDGVEEYETSLNEVEKLSKNLGYLMNFALAGAKSNVDGLDKLLNSEEES